MNKRIFSVFFFLLCFSLSLLWAQSKDAVSIIPHPLHLTLKQGHFVLNKGTRIVIDEQKEELRHIAGLLAQGLDDHSGFRPEVINNNSGKIKKSILLQLVSDTLGQEGYRLQVSADQILVTANEANGLFYGIQSIFQLLPADTQLKAKAVHIPAVDIVDKPRFGWRGLMLDVGRYFYSVDYIKKYIDYLAMHKMNVFHWHLVEDHGWRIEIKKYPKLTDVSAWRGSTNFQHGHHINPLPHGGFYTHDDVREVVAYAQSKYVTVVPEIELPGHVLSALVAYPELSCTGGPFEIPERWGIQKDVYCAGNEQVFQFLEDVLSEVAALFPSEIIHIGGDECPKDRWKECPKCQKRIKDENLKDEHELQSYFITRIEKFLNSKGKRIIGWDEILEGGLAPNAAVMSWRGIEGGIEAARMGHPVVMSPTTHMYFDYFQGEPYHEPNAIGGHLPLRKVYSYEPLPVELTAQQQEYIMGVQGNVWGEYIHSPEKADYMTYPRGAALAEIGWSAKKYKDFEDFKRRLEHLYRQYDKVGINYAKSAYQVYFEVKDNATQGRSVVQLLTDSYQPEIYYTLDGTEPTTNSLRYNAPFEVKEYETVRAATFKNGKRISPVSIRSMVHRFASKP